MVRGLGGWYPTNAEDPLDIMSAQEELGVGFGKTLLKNQAAVKVLARVPRESK